jgi:hypothetical protein
MSKPPTRRWKLTHRLRNHLNGVLYRNKFKVWRCHSRFIWNRFYEGLK